ncbi:MAG: hypothetical protein LBB27_03125, partial [Tannerellaceae bacterium]|nr:hypothetical protein [Tannerellaceae bacterium]
MSDRDAIVVKGARVNNLKGVDVELPRDSLIVVTGLSGSGKSSFAFDTLYAEGQRRYVESLSAYARQFVGRMRKPEVDFVTGIPPAVAIEQKVNTRNPRSTVGTSTEVYDYLRLLFARIGKTVSPVSGQVVKKHQVSDVVRATEEYPQGTRFLVCAPLRTREGQTPTDLLEIYAKAGYARVIRPDERDAISIEDALIQQETEGGEETGKITTKGEKAKGKKKGDDVRRIEKGKGDGWLLVVDRLTTEEGESLRSRLAESVETAFLEG